MITFTANGRHVEVARSGQRNTFVQTDYLPVVWNGKIGGMLTFRHTKNFQERVNHWVTVQGNEF